MNKLFVFFMVATCLSSCEEKRDCYCTGYEGLFGGKSHKFRENDESAAAARCESMSEGTDSDGIDCQLVD